jgi:hypothetical protein
LHLNTLGLFWGNIGLVIVSEESIACWRSLLPSLASSGFAMTTSTKAAEKPND